MKFTYFKSGDWNAICDVCGFKRKSSEMMKRWDGLMVCRPSVAEGCWEPQHPQEIIRPIIDQNKLPWTRPEPADVYLPVTPAWPPDIGEDPVPTTPTENPDTPTPPPTQNVISIVADKPYVTVGNIITFTVTIGPITGYDAEVLLTSSDPTVFVAPYSVIVTAGTNTATFTSIGLKVGADISMTATLNGSDSCTVSCIARWESLGLYAGTYAYSRALVVVDPTTGNIWSAYPHEPFDTMCEVRVNSDDTKAQIATFSTVIGSSSINGMCYVPQQPGMTSNEIWVLLSTFSSHDMVVIYDADALAYKEIADILYRGNAAAHQIFFNPVTNKVHTVGFGAVGRIITPRTRALDSSYSIGSIGTCWVVQAETFNDEFSLTASYGSVALFQIRNLSDNTLVRNISNPYPDNGNLGFTIDPTRRVAIFGATYNGTYPSPYNVINLDTGLKTGKLLYDASGAEPLVTHAMRSVVYCPFNDSYIFGCESATDKMTTLHMVNPDTFVTEYSWTYETYDAGVPHKMVPKLYVPKVSDATHPYIFECDLEYVKRYYLV